MPGMPQLPDAPSPTSAPATPSSLRAAAAAACPSAPSASNASAAMSVREFSKLKSTLIEEVKSIITDLKKALDQLGKSHANCKDMPEVAGLMVDNKVKDIEVAVKEASQVESLSKAWTMEGLDETKKDLQAKMAVWLELSAECMRLVTTMQEKQAARKKASKSLKSKEQHAKNKATAKFKAGGFGPQFSKALADLPEEQFCNLANKHINMSGKLEDLGSSPRRATVTSSTTSTSKSSSPSWMRGRMRLTS